MRNGCSQLRLQPFCSIIKSQHKMKTTELNYTPIQLKLPVDMERIIEINDSVYTFNEVVSHIDLKKYFVEKDYKATGRPRYEREKLLKVLLFAFMECGYPSLRETEKLCKVDIRFIWLLDEMKAPSYATLCDFINQELTCSLEEIVQEINNYIFGKENVAQIASSSWTPSGRKIGSILATVLVEASDSTKIGAAAAAQAAQTMSRNASKSSSGVQYPRFFLGRLLRASAAQRISSSEKFSMEIPLGTYRRSNPL